MSNLRRRRRQIPRVTVDALSYPLVVAHRGGANIAPENTMVAFGLAASRGCQAIEVDCHLMADGGIAVCHLNDYTSVTTATGNATDLTASTARGLVVDCASWFNPMWANTTMPLLQDVFDRFGTDIVYFLDCKETGVATAAMKMAQGRGLTRNIVCVVYNDLDNAFVNAAGGKCIAITNTDDAAAYVGQGFWGILGNVDNVNSDYVSHGVAAGLKVGAFATERRSDYDTWTGYGCHFVMSSDPIYNLGRHIPVQSDGNGSYISAPYASQTYWDGQLGNGGTKGTWPASGRWGFPTGAASNEGCLQGWACPVPWDSYSISFRMTADTVGADLSRWGSIFFGCDTDLPYTNAAGDLAAGYHFLSRFAGDLVLYKVTLPWSAASIASASGDAIADLGNGGFMDLVVTVTPTTITCTRTDTDPDMTISANDNTFRGKYFHFLKNATATAISWSNVVVRPI